MKTTLFALALLGAAWTSFWFTPDQQGRRALRRGEPAEAARLFQDSRWQGVAWFRAGEFARAEQAFARGTSAEAEYNRGNCLVMLGKYEAAIERYERALELRPDWEDARVNRDVAIARAKLVERRGAELGDQQVGSDDVTFGKGPQSGGQTTEVAEDVQVSDAAFQARWLRRVQTKPADFLKAKFAGQLARDAAEEARR